MKIFIFASKYLNKNSQNKIKNLLISENDYVVLCNNPDDPYVLDLLKKK
jgi:hypothetical protein